MSTEDLQLLNERIEARAAAGEHFVRPDVVEQRYVSGLKLLNHYFHIPDHMQLFDNSSTPTLIAEIDKKQSPRVYVQLPSWIVNYLQAHFQDVKQVYERKASELGSIEEVRKRYQSLKHGKKA